MTPTEMFATFLEFQTATFHSGTAARLRLRKLMEQLQAMSRADQVEVSLLLGVEPGGNGWKRSKDSLEERLERPIDYAGIEDAVSSAREKGGAKT